MSRTGIYKMAYVAVVLTGLVVVGLIVFVAFYSGGLARPWALVLLIVLMLAPGRVQGVLWRDFFRGRRLLAMGRHEASIPFFDRFLARVQARPRLKWAIWLSWGMYTRDIEVMTENNLGAAKLELGRWDEAKGHLKRALALDAHAPLPHYNLAMIFAARGMEQESMRHLARARQLGYRGAASDRLIRSAGELLARVEGRPLPPTALARAAGTEPPPGR